MSLDLAFQRLSLRSSGLCRQCRRAFTSAARRPQSQQSATGSFADTFQAARTQAATASPRSNTRLAPRTPPETTTANRPDQASAQRTSFDIARGAVEEASANALKRQEEERRRALEIAYSAKEYEAQNTRKWKPGDVYAPHDLSGIEMAKWKKIRRKGKTNWDVMDQLGMDPREHYKNFSIMSEYMTDMGRIKHRNETGLRPVNQRRMAKAIRRAIGMGLMPGVHRHPEILRMEMNSRNRTKGQGGR